MPGSWNNWEHYQQTARNQASYGKTSDWINGLAGGPVGWYKIASGEKGLGGSFGEHYAYAQVNDPNNPNASKANDGALDEATFNAMTDEEMQAFENMNYGQRVEFLKKKRQNMANGGMTPEQAAAKAEADKRDAFIKEQETKLNAFANEMGMSVDELVKRGDIGIKRVSQGAANQAGSAAYAAGLGTGGVSNMNTQRAMTDAMQGYTLQRQQLGAQARSQIWQQVENTRRYDQDIDLQLQAAQAAAEREAYQQQLQASGGTLGIIGAGLGAYFGKGDPKAMQAGYQIGSGLGQQNYVQSNPYKPYRYSYPTGTTRKGSGSGGLGV